MQVIQNPNFHIDPGALHADLVRMRHGRKPLARPVVILGGWHAPGVATWGIASFLRPHTSGIKGDFLSITYPMAASIAAAAKAVLNTIRARGLENTEVDIIGISMGGLVARAMLGGLYGAAPFRAARVFTVATPHRGASLARIVRPDASAREMQPGSEFLSRLDGLGVTLGYEMHCYAILRDWWVGASNCAPPGREPFWVDPTAVHTRLLSHFAINHDPRVLADIARRLRAEEPIAGAPSRPPRD